MTSPFRVVWDGCNRARWQQLLATAPTCSYRQDWPYGEAAAAQGHRAHRCIVTERGEPVAMAQFLERRFPAGLRILLLTHGPVLLGGREQQVEEALLAEVRRRFGRGLLFWTPAAEEGSERRSGCRRVLSGQSTLLLGLGRPLAHIEADLHGKWRNMLRRARENRLEIRLVQGGPLLAWLISANEAHRRKVGYRGPSPAFFHALAEASRPGRSQFALVARRGSTPVAGALFQLHGRCATYLVGHTGEEGRRLRAQHLLLWRGIEVLRERGTTQLDLGGVDTVGAPGVARFKLGLGGRVVTWAGTYLLRLPWRAERAGDGSAAGGVQKERAA